MHSHRPPLVLALLLVAVCGIVASYEEDRVCNSLDIRNSVSDLKVLENCTVIEGYLRIVLIERGLPEQYDNYSFPKLREITDYFLLFRVFGLPSIGKLFPNLAVIRGRELVHNYAFIVLHMQLEQIGLTNLMAIVRGKVLIDQNHKLCFADTIDWDVIAPSDSHANLIQNNRPADECQNCVSAKCPTSSRINDNNKHVGDQFGKLCWNEQQCQKICSPSCTNGCNPDNPSICCHPSCIGGCTGPNSLQCIACKHFKFKGQCYDRCPAETFEYLGRRCLTLEQCIGLSRKRKHKPFYSNGRYECILNCPAGYKENPDNKHECIKCNGLCEKVCQETYLNSIGNAQKLKGCTTINGSLIISIEGKRGANIVKELEEGLKDLKRITGYLKVSRSRPLISLHFLRNLEVIEGLQRERNNYSLLIFDNENLQELFPFNRSGGVQLRILKGRIFFHLNPKLCLKYIDELKNYSEIADYKHSSWDDYEVSRFSNGEKVPCEVMKLNVTVINRYQTVVLIKYDNFLRILPDQRTLLGYRIYYKETAHQNLTIYDGRDACNSNDWIELDRSVDSSNNETDSTLIRDLKPFTQYALFVKTFTMFSEKKGAISDIIYFKTMSAEPTPPTNLRATDVNINEVTIRWNRPKVPNGNVTHYIVRGTRNKNLGYVKDKNYCEEPLIYSTTKRNFTKEPEFKDRWLDNRTSNNESDSERKCCSCDKDRESPGISSVDERLQGQRREIEDQIINMLFVKSVSEPNDTTQRLKRSIKDLKDVFQQNISSRIEKPPFIDSNKNITDKNIKPPLFNEEFEEKVENDLNITIYNLSHFSEYNIEVQACLDEKPIEGNQCSSVQFTSVTTLSLGGADDIEPTTIDIKHDTNVTGTLLVSWDEPVSPNGAIISYEVEYKRYSTEKSDPIKRCVTRANYLSNGRTIRLTDLRPGNYSFRLRSKSLAGVGNWTTEVYRVVPSKEQSIATAVIVVTVLGVLLFVIIFVSATWYYVRRKFANMPEILYASVNPEYLSAGYMYEADEWEVARDKVKLIKELGQGSFGMVFEGELIDHTPGEPKVICAVKTVNETASHRDKQNFLQEATVMKAFNCNHVVKLLGVVSIGQPVFVLMEIMSNGDLRSFLRSHRREEEGNYAEQKGEPPTLRQILKMAAEIADGMAYLAAKKFVHRDLAARNCMVSSDLTVKIGDFGMTRDIYETDYYRKGEKGLLPIRWMAPESLKDGVFTSQSDVWSYGIVLWEMATLASQPYQGLANEQVLKFVINGGIMDRPENCPEKLYRLMRSCWTKSPKLRPTFAELLGMLIPDVVPDYPKFKEVSFYFTQRPQMLQKSHQQKLEKVNASTPLRFACDSEHNENENSCSDSEETGDLYTIKYFPSRMKVPESVDEQTLQIDENDEIDAKNHKNDLTNTSKVKSVSMLNDQNSKNNASSDGSKGSKISSTTSNGSIANGHISMYSTTAC